MRSNKLFSVLIVILFLNIQLQAQSTYTSSSDSDKEAITILDKTKEVLNNAKSIIFDYTFILNSPEQEPELRNGIAKQKGNMYYIEMGDKEIYCNGENIQVYSKIQNELQINDLDESSGTLTPAGILNSFGSENFIFVLGEDKRINKKNYFSILFKPIQKFSEYSKIELIIDKGTYIPYEIKMFYKDGARNTLKINSTNTTTVLNKADFNFDKTKYPDLSIEDLRMNQL